MKINLNAEAIFTFKASEYFLVHDSKKTVQAWSLNYRIDRSEKGKDDDCGIEVIYVSENEAEELKKAGFSVIDYGSCKEGC